MKQTLINNILKLNRSLTTIQVLDLMDLNESELLALVKQYSVKAYGKVVVK